MIQKTQSAKTMLWFFLLAGTAAMFMSACATTSRDPSVKSVSTEEKQASSGTSNDSSLEEILSVDADIEPGPHASVPMEFNSYVQKWLEFFTEKDRERFSQFLERGSIYRELIFTTLKEENVPKDMYYLAMIESGFVVHARSRAKAVGAWQFMRATGRLYGLRTDNYVDERRDIVRSTRAAARLLKALHDEFGSWYLAMAAYNAGEGRIRKAIRKGKSRDFWVLVQKRVMPRETMNYVPKFLAAVMIGRHPERYGFTPVEATPFPTVAAFGVPGAVRLEEVAEKIGLRSEGLTLLNPHLLRRVTPPGSRSYSIWVPKDKLELVAQLKEDFTQVKLREPVLTRSYSKRSHRRIASVKSKKKTKHRTRRAL